MTLVSLLARSMPATLSALHCIPAVSNDPLQSKMKMRVESIESFEFSRSRWLSDYSTEHFYDSFWQLLVGYLGKQNRQGQGRPLPQPANLI